MARRCGRRSRASAVREREASGPRTAGLRRGHPSPAISVPHPLGLPGQLSGLARGRWDLREPLFLQAAVAEAWLVQEDVCERCEPLTGWLVHARQREGLTQRARDRDRGNSSRRGTHQMFY